MAHIVLDILYNCEWGEGVGCKKEREGELTMMEMIIILCSTLQILVFVCVMSLCISLLIYAACFFAFQVFLGKQQNLTVVQIIK